MRLPSGKTPLGMLEQKFGRRNPSASDSRATARRLSRLLFEFPKYMNSISEVNQALDDALSKVGLRLVHWIDQAVPYGQSRQFLLETSDPNIIVAVQIYRSDETGTYEVTTYATHDARRRRRNPEGDYEDDVAWFIASVVAANMREGDSVVYPLPGDRGIRIACSEYGNQRAWKAELETKVFSEREENGEVFREIEYVRTGGEWQTSLEDLQEAVHALLHGASVHQKANPAARTSLRKTGPNEWDVVVVQPSGLEKRIGRLKRSRNRILIFSASGEQLGSYPGYGKFDVHEAAMRLHEMLGSRRGNPSDEEPTELPGEDIDAGTGEEPPRMVDVPEEADRIYEEFHGRPSDEEIFAEEEIQMRENLGVLGRLVQIVCECVTGQAFKINFGEDVFLCASADGKQLYIVGGDQSLDLEAMGFSDEQRSKDKVFIGSAQQVTYRTRKRFDDFAEIDYVHDFGEDGGTLPALVYDRLNQVIEFAGGDYEIKPEGIVN